MSADEGRIHLLQTARAMAGKKHLASMQKPSRIKAWPRCACSYSVLERDSAGSRRSHDAVNTDHEVISRSELSKARGVPAKLRDDLRDVVPREEEERARERSVLQLHKDGIAQPRSRTEMSSALSGTCDCLLQV